MRTSSLSKGGVPLLLVLLLAGCSLLNYSRPISDPSSPPTSISLEPVEATNMVRTEHTIKAVVKDAQGKPVHSALVEWTLARTPGAVGDIVAITQDPWIRALKLDNTFAISGLDRNGESSITITSPQEGITYIIASVPDIKDPANQKAFAIKNWVDARADFPAAATNRIGSAHVFSTRIVRVSDGTPLEGYDVYWRVSSGPAAVFDESGKDEAMTRTDESGVARATLMQASPAVGVNTVEIAVSKQRDRKRVCCPVPSGVIARGQTTKTWVAPPISIDTTCPPPTVKGDTAQFSFVVSNASQGELANVTVKSMLPAGFEYVSSAPDGRDEGGAITWYLGGLPVGASQAFTVTARATTEGTFSNVVTAGPQGGLDASASCSATVTEPAIRISQACPAEGLAGDALGYTVSVWNPGTAPATNVVVTDTVPEGMKHASGDPEVEWLIGDLAPGASVSQTFSFTGQSTGVSTNRVRVSADRGLSDASACSTVVSAPAVAIKKSGPEERVLGRTATYTIVASNPGTAPATGVVVTDRLVPAGMSYVSSSAGGTYNQGTRTVSWNVGSIPPGGERSLDVTLKTEAEGRYCDTATVEADRGLRESAEACTKVEGVPGVLIELVDVMDPIEVGGTTTYTIVVTNQGTTALTNLAVVATIPNEEAYVSHTTATGALVLGDQVKFTPLAALDPGQRFTHTVTVRGDAPADARFTVELSADQLTKPVRREESTHIYR